jgi:four helix bundle protein
MGGGMTTRQHRPAGSTFHALEVSIELIRSLRGPVAKIRRHSARLATQIEDAASSIAANVAEGNRRVGKDRLHPFRVGAGSADETRTHLRVAQAWGYVSMDDIDASLQLADRELAMLSRLTR